MKNATITQQLQQIRNKYGAGIEEWAKEQIDEYIALTGDIDQDFIDAEIIEKLENYS